MHRLIALTKKRLFYIILCAVLLVQVVSKIALGYIDTDTYFILAEGRDIFANGIKHINTFTVVPDLKIVVQQWLWCVITYGTYDLMGNMGLLMICILETIAIAALLFYIGRSKKMDPSMLLIMVSIFLFLFSEFISTRPNATTIILLLSELIALEKYKKSKNPHRGIYLGIMLTVLTFLEINLHASMWVFHFVFLLPYVVPPINTFAAKLRKRNYPVKPILCSMIPMAGVLFINPYGIDGILYLFRAYGKKLNSIGIGELQHVEITSLTGAVIIIALVFYIGYYMVPKRSISAETFYLFVGTMILGCICYRNFYYTCIGLFMLVCDALSYRNFDKIHDFINNQTKPVMFLAVAALGISVWYALDTGAHREADWEGEPIKAVEYLDEHASDGTTVYTGFNTGAFLEWSGYKVFIDARPELFMKKINGKEDVIDAFIDQCNDLDLQEYRDFVERYHFDYYLAAEGSLMDAFLQSDDSSKVVVQGEEYRLYEYTY